jgi:hypothetical protein
MLAILRGGERSMGKKSETFELENETAIPAMVAAIKKGAEENDIKFEGNNKQGKATRAGAEIKYKVEGKKVTVDVEDSWRSRRFGWPADKIMGKVKEWLDPYLKKK